MQYDPDVIYVVTVKRVISIPEIPHTIFRPSATYRLKGSYVTALGDAVKTAEPVKP